MFKRSIDGLREFWALSWWAKGPSLGVIVVLLIVVISLAASQSDAEDSKVVAEPTVHVTFVPAPSPTVLPAPSPTIETVEVVPSPTVIVQEVEVEPEPPPGPAISFGNGVHAVGTDIEPGTYRTSGPNADGLCYWARLSGFGGTSDEIITNDIPDGPTVVTISPSDTAFESSGCGIWTTQ